MNSLNRTSENGDDEEDNGENRVEEKTM